MTGVPSDPAAGTGWWGFALLGAAVFISILFHPANISAAKAHFQEVRATALRNWPPQFTTDKVSNPAGFAIDIMNRIA